MAANYVGHLVTFRNCRFEAYLQPGQELPIELLIWHLRPALVNAAIPYLIVSDKSSNEICAIYRVDGPHQHKIQPKNLTLVWKRADEEVKPKIWVDQRRTARELLTSAT